MRVRTTTADRTEAQTHTTKVRAWLVALVTLAALVGLPSEATRMALTDQSALTTFDFPGAIRTCVGVSELTSRWI